MRIAILGASGRLGQQILAVALSRGHTVQALARHPARIKRANESLTVYQGDAATGAGLHEVLDGCRKVVWAMQPTHPAVCMKHVIEALGARRIDRLIFLSWLGVGNSAKQARLAPDLLTKLTPRVRPGMFKEMAEAEEVLHASGVPHLVLRTTRLTDARAGAKVVVQSSAGIPPGPLGRTDLARFIMRVLEEPGWSDSELTVGTG